MSLKKWAKTILALGLTSAVAIATVSGIVKVGADANGSYTLEEVDYRSSYVVGETLQVKPADFLSGNDKLEAQSIVVHFPSGKAYSSDSVILSEAGNYTVEYKAKAGNALVSETKSFSVYDSTYSVSSTRSSATYNAAPSQPQGSPELEGSAKAGVQVSLAEGDTFRYNRALDLNKLGMQNALEMYLLPEFYQSPEAFQVDVRFVDAYDEDNYIWVRSIASSSTAWDSYKPIVMMQTACVPNAGQALMGWFYDRSIDYGGDWNFIKLKQGSTGEGYTCTASVYGMGKMYEYIDYKGHSKEERPHYKWFDCAVGSQTFMQYRFDYEKLQLHGAQHLDLNTLMTDFDDESIYGDMLWDGFKTGECYVEISVDQYVKEKFNFVVTEVGEEDLTQTTLTDEVGPEIKVDLLGYEENNLPEALVGSEYPVFAATATDSAKEMKVGARVFYNYGSANAYEIDSFGGKFLPTEEGDYTIVYESIDWYGNVSKKEITVTATTAGVPLVLTVDIDSAAKEGKAGTAIEVPVASVSGGIGNLTLMAVASNDTHSYDVEGGSFVPMSYGTYTVTYTLTDFVGQKQTVTYEIAVADEPCPVFIDTVQLPKYFLEGGGYTAPDLIAYDVHSSGTYETQIQVIDGNGTTTLKGRSFSPKADADGFATLRYTATNESGSSSVDYKVPVINVVNNVGKNDFKRYFVGENITMTSAKKNMTATTTAAGDISFDFAKEVLANGFSFKFALVKDADELSGVSIYLTDYEQRDKQVKVTFVKGENGRVYINDVRNNAIFEGFSSTNAEGDYSYVDFTYDGSLLSFTGFTQDALIETYLNGEAFVGFPSGKVYMTVTLEDAAEGTKLDIQQLNNTVLTSGGNDTYAPQISLVEAIPAEIEYGTTIVTPDFVAVDVYDTSVSVLMTVTDQNGNVITDKNGVKLENVKAERYEIEINYYGQMNIVYTVRDSAKSASLSQVSTIPDTGAPKLSLSGAVVSSAKVGDTITLPTATATDDVSGACGVYVLVFDNLMQISVVSNNTFTVTEKGIWTVKYFTYDATGNMLIVSYDIVVS